MPRHGGSSQRHVARTAGVRAPIGQLPDDRQPDGVGQRMQDGHQTDVPGARVMVAQHGTMFAPDARIEPASGPAVQGTTAIREFFHDFFARNAETRHLWLTRPRQDAPGDGGCPYVVCQAAVGSFVWSAWCFSDWGSFSSRESIGWRPCQQRNTPTSSRPKWCVR